MGNVSSVNHLQDNKVMGRYAMQMYAMKDKRLSKMEHARIVRIIREPHLISLGVHLTCAIKDRNCSKMVHVKNAQSMKDNRN